MGDGLRDEPGADPARGRRPAYGGLVVGEHESFLVGPVAEVSGSGPGDDVCLAAAPVRQWAPVTEALRQAAAPVPGEVLAVVELEGDAQVVMSQCGVFWQPRWQRVDPP